MAKTKEKKETAEKPKAPEMPTANGVRRPRPNTATGRVWEIADAISEKNGRPAYRAEVLETFVAEGGNRQTGTTQFGRWCKFHGLIGENAPGRAPAAEAEEEDADDAPEVE